MFIFLKKVNGFCSSGFLSEKYSDDFVDEQNGSYLRKIHPGLMEWT